MERLELGCDGDGERGEKEEANLVYWIVQNKVGSTSPSSPVQSSLPDQGGPTSPLVEMVNYK
jgi:hypothetical protein